MESGKQVYTLEKNLQFPSSEKKTKHFYHEDAESRFLQSAGISLPDYTTPHPIRL
jgi:hypothetical protein